MKRVAAAVVAIAVSLAVAPTGGPVRAAASGPLGSAAAAPWPTCTERTTPIETGLSEVRRTRRGRLIDLTVRSRAMQGEQQVRVLLPQGFDERRRYATLYLLHGAGGDHRNWVDHDGIEEIVGDLPVIVVMPQGSDVDAAGRNRNGSYTDWFGLQAGTPGPVPAWESYHVTELVPFVDAHFPTRANAAGRAIAGISMGGGGAMKYAAAHPGTFGYAGSLSGSLDRTVDRNLNPNCVRGNPAEQEVVWRDNNPVDLAGNLRGVRLFVRSGDGTPGPFDAPTPPQDPAERTRWQWRLAIEAGAYRMAQNFVAALERSGVTGVSAEFSPGSHSAPYWQRDLREFTGWLAGQLRRGPLAPPAFQVTSARPHFTGWGHSFRMHRDVREFAYLQVRPAGLTATGSGRLDVVTPERYRPGARCPVRAGGVTRWTTADRQGRLAFPVDLGPGHTGQQTEFGPDATRDWRTVQVSIGPSCRPPAPPAGPAPGPLPPERLRQSVVPVPAAVTDVRFPGYTSDGSRLLATATPAGATGGQVVSFAADGTGLRCLTCGAWTGADLLKPVAFPDGRRVLVRIGAQSPTSAADHGVVECAPSVLDCRTAAVVPIVPPAADDPGVDQDQREFRLAPDGRRVGLTQVRRTIAGRPTGVGIVGELVRGRTSYQVADAHVVAEDGELKGFTPDGRGVLFARFLGGFEAGNPDDVEIDLASGRERRVTRALDWDEDVDVDPHRHRGRGWQVVGSARGTGLLETVAQVRRPPAIEQGIQALPFAAFTAYNPQIAEPWLVDEFDARRGYLGQPLAPGALAAGWDSRPNFRWKPDGTAVVFWQSRTDGTATRVVIAHLPDRRPLPRPDAGRSPRPGWAPQLARYVPADRVLPGTLRGQVSGELRIIQTASPVRGYRSMLEVTYADYTDERGFVINGVERNQYDPPGLYGGRSLYSADLTISGRHRGYLTADRVTLLPTAVTGTIESRVDGRRLVFGPTS